MPRYNDGFGATLCNLSLEKTVKKKRAVARPQRLSACYTRGYDPDMPLPRGEDHTVHVAVPTQTLADRDRRMSLEHASLTAALCGDPLPGRSALDKRRPQMVAE